MDHGETGAYGVAKLRLGFSLGRIRIDEAWIREAERRLQELVDGRVEGIPRNQVIPEIRRELGWES